MASSDVAYTTPSGSGLSSGHHDGSPVSCTKATGAALTTAAQPRVTLRSGSSRLQPSSRPRMSTVSVPRTSDAVVMTGVAPSAVATRVVKSLPRPTWPDSVQIAKRASSSTQMTAGSTFLSTRSGAIMRTTAPTLITKTWQSYAVNVASRCGP